jgi:hypothetical protein
VLTAEAGVVAVLQGYGPQITATDLAEAAYAIEGGATWVATNRDDTLPTHRGIAPGNGALLGAVATATGVEPAVATGKPEPPLYDLAVSRLGVPKALVLAIGDRLDTDILGAMSAGLESLWVLTGVDDLVTFARAPGRPTPTYAASDLRVLARPPLVVARDGDDWVCGPVRLAVGWAAGEVRIDGSANGSADGTDALVAAGAAALAYGRDEAGVSGEVLTRVAGALASRLG